MNRKRKSIIAGNAVSELREFSLGGYRQKVLIEGKDADLPVLLTLHGGPGSPFPFSVGCRGLFPEYTDNFIMVYWDQLGSGINNHVIDDTFTVRSFVQMTKDLIRELKRLYPDNGLYVFAMSWGSLLSAGILENDSNIVDGVLVYGQIVKDLFFNEEAVKVLENSKLPRKKLRKIKAVDKEHFSVKDLMLISASIRKYTDGYNNKAGKSAPVGNILKGLLTSPDYRLKDFIAVFINGYMTGYLKGYTPLKEACRIDLSQVLSEVRIPYVILQGDTDIVTPTATVRSLVAKAANPNLKLIIVPDSGHLPGLEGMDTVFKELLALAGR